MLLGGLNPAARLLFRFTRGGGATILKGMKNGSEAIRQAKDDAVAAIRAAEYTLRRFERVVENLIAPYRIKAESYHLRDEGPRILQRANAVLSRAETPDRHPGFASGPLALCQGPGGAR